jgi:hypothetical protein
VAGELHHEVTGERARALDDDRARALASKALSMVEKPGRSPGLFNSQCGADLTSGRRFKARSAFTESATVRKRSGKVPSLARQTALASLSSRSGHYPPLAAAFGPPSPNAGGFCEAFISGRKRASGAERHAIGRQ